MFRDDRVEHQVSAVAIRQFLEQLATLHVCMAFQVNYRSKIALFVTFNHRTSLVVHEFRISLLDMLNTPIIYSGHIIQLTGSIHIGLMEFLPNLFLFEKLP